MAALTYELNLFGEAERLESESLGVHDVFSLNSIVNVGLLHLLHLLSDISGFNHNLIFT